MQKPSYGSCERSASAPPPAAIPELSRGITNGSSCARVADVRPNETRNDKSYKLDWTASELSVYTAPYGQRRAT